MGGVFRCLVLWLLRTQRCALLCLALLQTWKTFLSPLSLPVLSEKRSKAPLFVVACWVILVPTVAWLKWRKVLFLTEIVWTFLCWKTRLKAAPIAAALVFESLAIETTGRPPSTRLHLWKSLCRLKRVVILLRGRLRQVVR